MANQNTNFVETMVNAQKNLADTIVENTKKVTNGNTVVNETIQKGNEWFQNWLDAQKNFFNQSTDKTASMTNNMQDAASKMTEFYQNWMNNQMNWGKQIWEMNQNWFNAAASNSNNSNPTEMWNNWMNNWNTWTNNMNQAGNWMNNMNQWNNLFNQDTWKKTAENWNSLFSQYYEMMNNNFSKWQESIQNGTAQDAYKNMLNATEGFTRFYEMWAPMWKSIQDKTFNLDMYKQFMNPASYKEMLDKFFGFLPESTRQYMQQMSNMMQDGMKQMNAAGMNNYQQMRGMMNNMPFNASEMFANILNGYNGFYNMMEQAAAPINKMITANEYTKNMAEWKEIANRIAIYNIKNAELQYMVYNQGVKVMDSLAENIAAKVQNGEEINSMMALYQEWLNIGDKTFVSLFESDEYSKLMAETNSLQLRLKKDIELQMEKSMSNIPVATRSEMDEMYKTIYELKKQIRQMEKMMGLDNEEATEEAPKARKSAKK